MAHHLLIALAFVAAVFAQNANFILNCVQYPQVCNNKCYAIFVAGAPQTVTYSKRPAEADQRRRTAGTIPNPCCNGNMNAPPICSDPDGTEVVCNSPDEYPYASSDEYGNGPSGNPTYIRCTGIKENVYEGTQDYNNNVISRRVADGGCGNQRGCRITLGFAFVDIRSDACINKGQQRNDGFYYKFDGRYTMAKRDGLLKFEPKYERAEPPLEAFIPPSQRRELLLDDGQRIIVAPEPVGAPARAWIGEVWITTNGTARVVEEIFGDNKSPQFR